MDWLREKVATKVDLSDLPPKFGEPEGSLLAMRKHGPKKRGAMPL